MVWKTTGDGIKSRPYLEIPYRVGKYASRVSGQLGPSEGLL